MPLLAPALAQAFAGLGLNRPALRERLAGIACVRGPGNFTGLRLSLSTALGLGRSLGAPLAGLDYLPLLAAGPCAMAPGSGWQSVYVVTHARQGEVYLQGFACDSEAPAFPRPLAPAATLPLQQAVEVLEQAAGPCAAVGGALAQHAAIFAPLATKGVTLLAAQWRHPQPWALLAHAAAATYGSEPVAPLYLRVSDAEENLPQIARKQGQDPEAMRAELQRLTGEAS